MPEKVIHEIRLNQYSAVPADRTRRFSLGTKDSYGIEQLRIVPGEGWDGLTITATFHPPEGEAVQVLVPADGLIDVPPEATRSGSELTIRYGKIVFAGVADGMQRISCNLPYTVLDHAPVEGAESSGPAPSWYEQAAAHFLPGGGKAGQVLAKASDADLDVEWADGGGSGTADHAKLSNRDASDQHPISAITGLETALDAKQPAGSYLTQESDPTVPDWAKQPEKPSYTADEVGALSAATLPEAITTALAQATASGAFDGADGQDGITPTIGENGNWYLGDTDTGKPSRGETGPQGPKGDTGAAGATGPAGADGISPHIGSNGNWYTGDTDTGVSAQGPAGAPGKTAYQYAQDGGYTGTEAEFAERMAAEIPAVDSTLTQSGQAADAAAVGNRISTLSEEIDTTSESKVSAHNSGTDTHSDIRLLIQGLTDRLNALADSDDTTLDQLSEVVAYIKSNRGLIEAITTSKVSVADIVDNLTTNVANKPLSAAQGVALKALIDAITVPDKLPNPNALTFTGAVSATYDGSEPVTVEIPSGGSGGVDSWELVNSVTTSEEVAIVEISTNSSGETFSLDNMLVTTYVPYGTNITGSVQFISRWNTFTQPGIRLGTSTFGENIRNWVEYRMYYLGGVRFICMRTNFGGTSFYSGKNDPYPISSVKVITSNSTMFPVGTVVGVYKKQ